MALKDLSEDQTGMNLFFIMRMGALGCRKQKGKSMVHKLNVASR